MIYNIKTCKDLLELPGHRTLSIESIELRAEPTIRVKFSKFQHSFI